MTAAIKIPETGKMTLTASEYHAHSAVGSTSLKNVLRSPAHYKYELENPSEQTPAQAFGTAAHEAILEPNLFTTNAVVMPKFEGTGSRNAKEQWLLENHGRRVLKAEEMADILGMLKAISLHKTARGLLAGGAAEESFFWIDPLTGIPCKCRPDFLRAGNILVDVKTTQDASLTSFQRDITNFKYHMQAAHYLAGVSAVTGETFDKFLIVAVEKYAPYGVAVYQLDESTIEKGGELRTRALGVLAECAKTKVYPCYPDEVTPVNLTPWGWNE